MSILLDDDLGLLDVISPHSSSSAPSSPTLSPHWKQPQPSTQHVTSSPLSLSSTTDDDDLFEASPPTQSLMFSPSIAPISMTRLPSLSMKPDESLPSLSMKTDDFLDPIIDTDISSQPRDIIRADVMSRIISDGMTTHMTDMMERGNEYDEMLTSQHQHILNALSTETSIFPAFQYGWPNETTSFIASTDVTQSQTYTTTDVTPSQTYTAPVVDVIEQTPSIKTEPISASAEPAPVPVVAVVPTPAVNPTSPVVTRTTRRTRGSPTAASAATATATPTSISVVVDPVTEPIIERRASASSAASLPAPASPLAGSRRARKRTKGSTKSTSPSRTTSSPTTSTTSTTVTGRKRKKSTASIKKESDIEDDDESVTSKSTVVDKKQQRLERNRASAQLSRERRKNYMSQLEEQLRELTASNQNLTQQLNALDHENQTLKKLIANKKAASTTPSSTPSETGAARSALLLFAVVISFGLFFHMAGLPQQTEPVGIRVQTSVPTPGPSMTTLHRSRVLSSIETESDKALIKLEETMDNNARALVPIVKQESSSDLGLALDVYKQDTSTGAITETTTPVAPTTPAEDPLIAYEKLLAGSNFTHDPDAAYMFCPSALQMHIQHRNDTVHTNITSTSTSSDMDSKRFQLVDEHAKRSRERSDRLRRVMGLSDDKSSVPIVYTSDRTSSSHGILPRRTVPNDVPSYHSIGADAAKMYLSSRSDRLLLWVPIRALNPQWEYNHTMADSTDSGLVEIDCRIDDIRPLLLA